MKINSAKIENLQSIMEIEKSSFIPQIQENSETFAERINVFPQGFFLLQEKSNIIGYFSSEIWNSLPNLKNPTKIEKSFTLGHSAKSVHNLNGTTLYIISFAISPNYQGKKLGSQFFSECLKNLCTNFPKIETLLLLVNQQWKGAQHIYKSHGFSEQCILKDFFPTENETQFSDGIIMTCSAKNFR